MTILVDKEDHAMNFETLFRDVLECGRSGDPWNYANADHAVEILENNKEKGISAFNTLVDIAIYKNRTNNILIEKLLNHKSQIKSRFEKRESTQLMYEIIDTLNKY